MIDNNKIQQEIANHILFLNELIDDNPDMANAMFGKTLTEEELQYIKSQIKIAADQHANAVKQQFRGVIINYIQNELKHMSEALIDNFEISEQLADEVVESFTNEFNTHFAN